MTENLTNRNREDPPIGAVLVVGGGIGGMAASLDLAESGYRVYLVEKEPSIGGTMAQLDKTFPTNDCAMCTLAPRLVDAGKHLNIEKLTYSEVLSVEGEAGRFKARVLKKARSVDSAKCTGCGSCMEHCVVHNRPHPPQVEPVGESITGEDLSRVAEILDRYGRARSGTLAILQDVFAVFKWLPEWSLRVVSVELGVPLTHVLRLATFFKAFSLKPRGKHVCTVCMGTACHVRGASKLVEQVEREFGVKSGETTADLNLTLETVNCVGACALGPLVLLDGEYHGNMTSTALDKVLTAIR